MIRLRGAWRYKLRRLSRWAERFKNEYLIKTNSEWEKELGKSLDFMEKGGRLWHFCLDRDAYEAILFLFMESPVPKHKRDHQYYYGRILLTGIFLHSIRDSKTMMYVVKREVEEILCEFFTHIREDIEGGFITGKVWEYPSIPFKLSSAWKEV